MNITLDDGRTELWQWDTGRKIVVDDKSVSEVHYSKYSSTQAITREVINGKAEIPNFLLQDTHAVTVYAYSGSVENGYTMAEKTFNILKKPKPANYVETEEDKAILAKLKAEIGDLSTLQTEAKDNLVVAINEAAASGGADWAQNDPTAKDYVKNRTHYTEIVETSSGVGAHGFIAGYMNSADSSSTFSKVTVSGNVYRDVVVVPNGMYLTASVGNYALSFDQMYNNLSVSPSDANANDFEFFIKKEETHTIPDEYIPSWVMNKEDAAQPDWNKYYETDKGRVKNRPNIYMEPGTLENTTIDGDSPSITPAAIFIFYGDFNGKICTRRISMNYSGETITRDIVNPYTGEVITDDDCPAGVMIVRCNFDVARKPIFRCVNPVIKDYFASTDALPQHEMSAAPTKDMQIATKGYVDDAYTFLENRVSSVAYILKAEQGNYGYWNIDGQSIEEWYTKIKENPSNYPILCLYKGTYNVKYEYEGPLFLYSITDAEIIYKRTLEDGNWVGFKLSAVDGSPSKNGFIKGVSKEFILASSTVDSTKKFKITVDDSGTITTMEV